METTNRLTYLSTKFFTENKEEYRITVRISLDDDCKNNICDWSITADVDWKNKYGNILIGITPIYKRRLWSEEVKVVNDKMTNMKTEYHPKRIRKSQLTDCI